MKREADKNNGVKQSNGNRRRKPRVYICCPVRPKAKDPEEAIAEVKGNLERAERACNLVLNAGGIPLCSQLYCIYGLNLNECDPEDRELGLEIGLDMLRFADEVHVFSERISEGMAAEINLASQLGIPVRMLCEEPGFLGDLMTGISVKE